MSERDWIIGWDLGGAHLKIALADGAGRIHRLHQGYTPLWRGLDHLDRAIDEVAARFPLTEAAHRLTMTGELVDLFEDRDDGVAALSNHVSGRLDGLDLAIYAGPAGFVDAAEAGANAGMVASANWHATAALVSQCVGSALLVDIGSTTTDLIPLRGGGVACRGYSDAERQRSGELVYTGVVRTPVMSLAEEAPLDGDWVGLAAEHFATTADLYRLTGELPDHADLGDTADGRGKGRDDSAARLARMVGEDTGSRDPAAWRCLARYLVGRQLDRIERAVARQCSTGLPDDAPLVAAGVGRFLLPRLADRLQRPWIDIAALFDLAPAAPEQATGQAGGADVGDCAPAAAVALLELAESQNHRSERERQPETVT